MDQLLAQKRAACAMDFVLAAGSAARELHGHIRRTPIRVLQNGLGQAIAFLVAKSTSQSHQLYDLLQEWLCGPCTDDRPCRIYGGQDLGLMRQLIDGSSDEYYRAREECLALFEWLKKFADAYIEEPE